MQEELRTALSNLQGMFDEGFLSTAEYNARRKAIIDGATKLPDAPATKPAAAKPAAPQVAVVKKPKTVFDRLGRAVDGDEDMWQHDGFAELYGSAAAKASAKKETAVRFTPYQPPQLRSAIAKADLRSRIKSGNPQDLRNQLSGGRGRAGGRAGGRASRVQPLPAKCPW